METNVCKYCGKMFESSRVQKVCKDCVHKDDAQFSEIIKYLELYPGSSAIELASIMNINPIVILDYIEEGRLSIIEKKE